MADKTRPWSSISKWNDTARGALTVPSESESEVAQSCPTLCDPVDYSPPGSSVHGILRARILEWVAISFSRGSSRPRNRTQVSRIAGRHFNLWATREAHDSSKALSKDQGVGGSPNPENLHPFPKMVGIILPLISIRNYPTYTKLTGPHFGATLALCDGPHSVCGVCFSPNLNKSTSYLSLCLSVNSFWDETSRIWASLGFETRYQRVWAGFKSQAGLILIGWCGCVLGLCYSFKSCALLHFHCKGHRFNSWLGKFHMPCSAPPPKTIRNKKPLVS